MKKVIITCLVVMIAASGALAQASVSLGLKGGLNFAKLDVSSAGAAYNSRTGYHVGAFANFKFTKLAIQPELIYSVQGADAASGNLDLGYFNVPILLKFYLIGGLNLQAGPQFGFLTSATSGGSDVKSLLKGSDTSLALGAGFDISNFVIDARYNLGLSEIQDNAAFAATKNQVFQLSVGFKLFKFGN